MSNIIREIWVDAPQSEVWDVLADFGNIYRFSPTVLKSYSINDKPSGLGAERHNDFSIEGSSVDERIVEWHEGQKLAVELYNGQGMPPWKNAVAEFSVREHKGGTMVRGAINYDMKFGPIGALMDRFMIKPQFGEAFGSQLAGLKHHVETGEEVTELEGLPMDQLVAVAS